MSRIVGPNYGEDIIDISEVLYEFNEPLIFLSKTGLHSTIYVKTDEFNGVSEYLACYIDNAHIEGLKEGRISILGVYEQQAQKIIVTANEDLIIQDARVATITDLEEGRLPQSGAGILPRFGDCPDVLQEKDAFLSVYFKGGRLRREQMPFSTMMNLLGSVQSFVRGIILPADLRGSKSSTFDFLVKEPSFGSLMVSIKEPIYNFDRVRQAEGFEALTVEQINTEFSRTKNKFMQGAEELFDLGRGRNNQVLDDIEEVVYSPIRYLLPSDDTDFESVTFASNQNGSVQRVSFDRDSAEAVRRTFNNRRDPVVNRQGVIIEINANSSTLLLQSAAGTTTCRFEWEVFQELRGNPIFRIGSRMRLRGELTERVRRDYLVVRRVLELS